jgi:hypothetical protein
MAILLALFLGSPGLASGQEEARVTLTCSSPTFKTREPKLILKGGCPLPDGTVLKVTIHRMVESCSGGQMVEGPQESGGGLTEAQEKKFSFESVIVSPGRYLARLSLSDEFQRKDLLPEIKRKAPQQRQWPFECSAWGDDLARQISPRLVDLAALVAEAREKVQRFEKAAESPQLLKENGKLLEKIENSILMKALFPAGQYTLQETIRSLQGSAPYFAFEEGKFVGVKSPYPDGPTKTFRNELFTFAAIHRYLEEVIPIAGREFSLWIVKDLRRTSGVMSAELLEALRSQKAAPGVAPYAERLEKAVAADLDALERDIRAYR